MNAGPSELGLFLGSFHPVLVHLPIGFLIALVALEALALLPRFRPLAPAAGFLLALAIPALLLSAGSGWLLAQTGGYSAPVLSLHRWAGTAVAAAVLVLAAVRAKGCLRLYRVLLALSLFLLLVAGHAGGSLTHGQDFLSRHAPWRKASAAPASPYAASVRPLLQKYCVECHGPDKAKGDLRLDAQELAPNSPALIKSLQRLRLPMADEDHMPPAGKAQPTAEEIAVIAAWAATAK